MIDLILKEPIVLTFNNNNKLKKKKKKTTAIYYTSAKGKFCILELKQTAAK